jgi:hypothetical protein
MKASAAAAAAWHQWNLKEIQYGNGQYPCGYINNHRRGGWLANGGLA